jgi:hypothetical protein
MIRTHYFLAAAFIGLIYSILPAQTIDIKIVLPQPEIGWDSLSSKLQYPDYPLRAEANGAYITSMTIDSTGGILSINTIPMNYKHTNNNIDSVFVNQIQTVIRSIHWLPAIEKGKRVESHVQIPIVFYLTDKNSMNINIVRCQKKIMEKGIFCPSIPLHE